MFRFEMGSRELGELLTDKVPPYFPMCSYFDLSGKVLYPIVSKKHRIVNSVAHDQEG